MMNFVVIFFIFKKIAKMVQKLFTLSCFHPYIIMKFNKYMCETYHNRLLNWKYGSWSRICISIQMHFSSSFITRCFIGTQFMIHDFILFLKHGFKKIMTKTLTNMKDFWMTKFKPYFQNFECWSSFFVGLVFFHNIYVGRIFLVEFLFI